MTGYRSGFIAGDPEMIRLLDLVRPSQGVATPLFVQDAAIVAWSDEKHVDEQRRIYRRKREILIPALEAAGFRIEASQATFYLWVRTPEGTTSESFHCRRTRRDVGG